MDSFSRGGTIASKIGLAMSRILKNGQIEEDDEEIRDLLNLIEDLNKNSDLTDKLTNQSKISLFLQKAGDKDTKPGVQKDYKAVTSNAKASIGMFQSKLRLEMKSLMFDPRVKEIIDASRQNLEKLQKERDAQMKQFQADQLKKQQETIAHVDKLFVLKLRLAQKAEDPDKLVQV